MGSSSSKFKKYLLHGDEYAAMQVYQSSNELRRALDPNHSYGDQHFHNTPLHYAALGGSAACVSMLLDARASVHAVDEDDASAHLICEQQQRLLLLPVDELVANVPAQEALGVL